MSSVEALPTIVPDAMSTSDRSRCADTGRSSVPST
ncbi:hypothetical protein IWX63_002662 [Arthrobacter sp. CAN_A2]